MSWSIAIDTSFAIGVAPHAITPDAEFPGPCAPRSTEPRTHAHVTPGTFTGLNTVDDAGEVTGTNPSPPG